VREQGKSGWSDFTCLGGVVYAPGKIDKEESMDWRERCGKKLVSAREAMNVVRNGDSDFREELKKEAKRIYPL
jgi:hypothetical protein